LNLLVVSHPSVVAVNQSVYGELAARGWSPTLVVPDRWRHEYSASESQPQALPSLIGRVLPLRVCLPGRPQRHFYLSRPSRVIASCRPAIAFIEQEPFSIPAFQWGMGLARAKIPFGVQMAENLDRSFQWPARLVRDWVLRHAAFVAARSPAAAKLVERWGATGPVGVVPHPVPPWKISDQRNGPPFTVGYAGRLTAEKGVHDLIAAVERLRGPVRLLLVGDGPLKDEIMRRPHADATVEIVGGVAHNDMPAAYAEMDVLVLASRSTSTSAEQFGRVLVEALWCGVPIVASDCGEMPWVVESTGGGHLFHEGDVSELAHILERLRERPAERRVLAEVGRAAAKRLFSVEAAATALEELLRSCLQKPQPAHAAPTGGRARA
jgi:glycosyltransferase involved in cell wall biosynthesis